MVTLGESWSGGVKTQDLVAAMMGIYRVSCDLGRGPVGSVLARQLERPR